MYFVDRWDAFSIWDVDFVPIPTIDPQPPAIARAALVQAGAVHRHRPHGRLVQYYRELFGFDELPDDQRFGILPKGGS